MKWHNEKRNISDLIPAEYNPRKWSDIDTKNLTQSIERFDLADPIVINKNNTIIGGHFRLKILKEKNLTEVDVRVPDRELTAEEERELNIRLNKNLGQWDFDALANFDEDLLKDIGFDSKELDKIFQLDTKPEDDDVPEARTTDIKLGDMFQLGEHRLLCGDATQRADVERLMDGKKADMVFTDPPYGVSYDGGVMTKRAKLIGDDTTGLYEPCCLMAMEYSVDDAPLYLWHAGVKGIAAAAAAAAAGYEIRCEIVWNKNHAQFGALSAQYKQKHEPCYYCFKKGNSARWHGPTNEVTVWDIDRSVKNEFHPTQKPVELATRAIRNHDAESVLDLFLGSGSTLIACEKTNRKCYGMEIDPVYCDVIINRWEKYTGNKAVKENERKFEVKEING